MKQEKKKYLYRVTKVAVKYFDEIIGYFSSETQATTPGKAYVNLLCQAKRKYGFEINTCLTFDKSQIVQVRQVLPGEFKQKNGQVKKKPTKKKTTKKKSTRQRR